MVDYKNDPSYTFETGMYRGAPAKEYKREDLPQFSISDELKAAVYDSMPSSLSCEEKAIYVYHKLCSILDYNEDFFYQKKLGLEYGDVFSEDFTSKIVPGSKVVCGDFSVIYYQFLSEIDGVEPVIIEQDGGDGSNHYLPAFYTDRVSLYCEAINLTRSNTIGYGNIPYSISANDIARAKSGIMTNGIFGIDTYNIMPQVMHDMYVAATGREPVTNYENMFYEAQDVFIQDAEQDREEKSISDLLDEFHEAPKPEFEDFAEVFEKKFKAFIKVLQKYELTGNSAYIAFYNLDEIGYFGGKTIDTKIGEKTMQDGKQVFDRLVIMQREDSPKMYLFDPRGLTLVECTREAVEKRLSSGEWMYEKDDEKIID